jgi:phosphoserine phosphatase RsbU/P
MASLTSLRSAIKEFKQKHVRTRMERVLWYTAIYNLAFALLRLLFHWKWLDSTIDILGLVFLFCLSLLGLRWVNRRLLWRLRNRLIVTYVFIGVIPVVLLIAIGLIAGYLFAGQFATFVFSNDLQSELKALDRTNAVLTESLAAGLRSGVPLNRAIVSLRPPPGTTVTAWIERPAAGNPRAESYVVPTGSEPASMTPMLAKASDLKVIAGDGGGITLRAAAQLSLDSIDPQHSPESSRANSGESNRGRFTVISSRVFDTSELATMAADLGEVSLYGPDVSKQMSPQSLPPGANVSIELGEGSKQRRSARTPSIRISKEQGRDVVYLASTDDSEVVRALAPIEAGSLPPAAWPLDTEVVFATSFDVADWNTGKTFRSLLKVRTRPSLLYHRLFVAVGEFAEITFVVLAAIAVIFAAIELVALLVGVSLTRTITRSVGTLYGATSHINRGDFTHRIAVKTEDQLASLEDSFNTMSASLERLIAEQKEKERMESELAIAREVQSQLFPRQLPALPSIEMFGLCRPARSVSGDYYDFLPLGADQLGIAVGDISGKGISAALLMATIHSAVRVCDFGRLATENSGRQSAKELVRSAGADFNLQPAEDSGRLTVAAIPASALQSPAILMGLLNHHLFLSTPPAKYATLFLGVWDGASRMLSYCNAGHPPPFVIAADGSIEKLDVGGSVIGLFDNLTYRQACVKLASGALLVAYSDGVTEPENEFGEFGESRLLDIVRAHRDQPLERISEAVLSAVQEWIGSNPQPDDVTLVLARAR